MKNMSERNLRFFLNVEKIWYEIEIYFWKSGRNFFFHNFLQFKDFTNFAIIWPREIIKTILFQSVVKNSFRFFFFLIQFLTLT